MKNLFLILIAIITVSSSIAQTSTETSDPQAKSILEKLRKKHEQYEAIEANFSLLIEIPEEEKEEQKGKLVQKGDMYKLDLDYQAIYSDGSSLWLYLKNNNEVQINDVDDFEEADDEFMSPKDLLRIYEKEDFIYQLINDGVENGKAIQQIEFKPTNKDSEYFKMRLTLDKEKNEVMRIKAFSKDGARYTMTVHELKPNLSYEKKDFVFDPSKYPDIFVEDLRVE